MAYLSKPLFPDEQEEVIAVLIEARDRLRNAANTHTSLRSCLQTAIRIEKTLEQIDVDEKGGELDD